MSKSSFRDSNPSYDPEHESKFSLSLPSSAATSRSSSPAPNAAKNSLLFTDSGAFLAPTMESRPPGRQSADAYDAALPWWRGAIRRVLVESVRRESHIIAKMQDAIRTPWLDAYFVYTSSLGTHTFFMIVLPAFFFFGYEELGHGLLMVLALGVYVSSFVKDLICSPRPFAPPVTRLTIGTHHLEYGFPSTHSTNSVSIALFLFAHIYILATPSSLPTSSSSTNSTLAAGLGTSPVSEVAPIISSQLFGFLSLLLGWYAFSIVFGRLYTAMHSFTDCIMGTALGSGIWWAHSSFPGVPYTLPFALPSWLLTLLPTSSGVSQATETTVHLFRGLGMGRSVEDWVRHGGWEVPLILIPICLLAVNQHPQPVDDCPCFEDAIAFGSVVLGSLLGQWGVNYWGIRDGIGSGLLMPGSGWVFDSELEKWIGLERSWSDVGVWWGMAGLKMVVGILVIFVWRILAKSALHLVLPPTFRLFARAFQLPNRRFYTPATDYKSVPSEFSHTGGGLGGLRPIPSVIDLSSGMGVEVGGIGSGSGYDGLGKGGLKGITEMKLRGDKARNGSAKGSSPPNGSSAVYNASTRSEEEGGAKEDAVKHYDADVLTKVIVYAGIAVLATEALPVMFEVLGWGLTSWPSV